MSRPRRDPDALVEVATTLFSRYGFKRTSIEDIAREAGIAKGTVYLSFPSKEAIFRAVCRQLGARILLEQAAAEGDLPGRLVGMLDAKFGLLHELVHHTPHAAELLASSGALAADVWADVDARYLAALGEVVAEAHHRGEIDLRRWARGGVEARRAEALAGALGRIAEGVGSGFGGAPPADREAWRARLRPVVDLVLAGLGSQGPVPTLARSPTPASGRVRIG